MRIQNLYLLYSLAVAFILLCLWWFSTENEDGQNLTGSFHQMTSIFEQFQSYNQDDNDLVSRIKIRKPSPKAINTSVAYDVDLRLIENIPLLMDRHRGEDITQTDNLEEFGKVEGLTFRNRQFYLNGKRFTIFSGAVHYFRVVPEQWEDRLRKLRACGLNTVETYVAWNLHEPSPGKFYFDGILDLRKFIQLAGELGLYVILRPGPYICSEFDFGGLPGWLLDDPHMVVRTNYPGYVRAVSRFFAMLLPLVKDLQFTEGGPIIMVQVENEYGVYGSDIDHLKLLSYILQREGIKELLVTSDNSQNELDFSKYALPTANFQQPQGAFDTIASLNNDFPLMVMEFWTGWFDVWGQQYHSTRTVPDLDQSLVKLLESGVNINFYMFHGGTNFGFTAGAVNITGYMPFTTSYDYDALLTESGDITPKYMAVRRRLLQFYKHFGTYSLPKVPPNSVKSKYSTVLVREMIPWKTFIKIIPVVKIDPQIKPMEMYGNGLGYIVYSIKTKVETLKSFMTNINSETLVHDQLLVIVNGELIYINHGSNTGYNSLYTNKWHNYWKFITDNLSDYESVQLDLLVENQGRVSYSPGHKNLLNRQRKGLFVNNQSNVFKDLNHWEVRLINFNPDQYEILFESPAWSKVADVISNRKQGPAVYRGYLEVKGLPTDTFVALKGWIKGVVLINGFNLGRYWSIGPQKTLFLPSSLLTVGYNEILIFEEQTIGTAVSFVNTASLQEDFL